MFDDRVVMGDGQFYPTPIPMHLTGMHIGLPIENTR
jgi:hypothetical protein